MKTQFTELRRYERFDELVDDVLELAKEVMPDQLFYLSAFHDSQQIILKLSNERTNLHITEGMVVDLTDSVCSRIDFEKKSPLVYADVQNDCDLPEVRKLLDEINAQSYVGIPISLTNGETFGTLCAINDEVSLLDAKSIRLLQRIVKLFSYYLELERVVWRDMLTELYNRRYLVDYFEREMNASGALFFLDLDGFKRVNDQYGHDRGDAVLQEVAARLQSIVNEQEDAFAVRLGGDEFILHFSNSANREEWGKLASRLIKLLSTWGTDHQVSTSIGIATYSSESQTTLDTLLKRADYALYQAKASGKRTYQFAEDLH